MVCRWWYRCCSFLCCYSLTWWKTGETGDSYQEFFLAELALSGYLATLNGILSLNRKICQQLDAQFGPITCLCAISHRLQHTFMVCKWRDRILLDLSWHLSLSEVVLLSFGSGQDVTHSVVCWGMSGGTSPGTGINWLYRFLAVIVVRWAEVGMSCSRLNNSSNFFFWIGFMAALNYCMDRKNMLKISCWVVPCYTVHSSMLYNCVGAERCLAVQM